MFKVKLTEQIGWTVSATHNMGPYVLADIWAKQGWWECIVTYKGNDPGSTEAEVRIIPWHMVACIDPVPYPVSAMVG